MRRYETECVSCGLPCLYEGCPYYKVEHFYCDRCGKPIRTPWRLDRTLCIECARQLDIDVNSKKVPWDNNDFWSTVITTGIRFGG